MKAITITLIFLTSILLVGITRMRAAKSRAANDAANYRMFQLGYYLQQVW
jgi:hypothetical protein